MGPNDLAATSSSSGFNPTFLILIILVVGVFWLMSRSRRRQQQQASQRQDQVVPGVRVKTTAGMYATVIAVEGDDVILEIAPGVEAKFMKRAIMEVNPTESTDTDEPADATGFVDAEAEPQDDEPAAETAETHTAETAADNDEFSAKFGTPKD